MKKIDFEISEDNLEDDLKTLYVMIRSNAKADEIQYEELKGGIVNSIVRLNDPENKESIVFRINSLRIKAFKVNSKVDDGNSQSFKFINRDLELAALVKASELGITYQLLSTFNNGFVYKYFEGTVNRVDQYDLEISKNAAYKMARLHNCIKLDTLARQRPLADKYAGKEPDPFQKQKQYLDDLIKNDDEYADYRSHGLASYQVLQTEYEQLDRILNEKDTDRSIAFCHNDLTLHNLLIDSASKECLFIDFEMANTNYIDFDIGYHLVNLCGVFCSYFEASKLPNEKFIKNWLVNYHTESSRLNNIQIDNFIDYIDHQFEKIQINMQMVRILMIQRSLFHSFLYPGKLDRESVLRYCIAIYSDFIQNKKKIEQLKIVRG